MTHAYHILVLDENIYKNNKLFKAYHQDEAKFTVFAGTICQAENFSDAIPLDVIFVNLDDDIQCRIDFIDRLTHRFVNLKSIILTNNPEFRHFILAARAGARGFLFTDNNPTSGFQAIRQLMDFGSYIHPKFASAFLESMTNKSISDAHSTTLSPREFDVLSFIAKGFTSAKIAQSLGISNHTVGTHIKNLYKKLSIHTKGEAIVEAIKLGLIHVNSTRNVSNIAKENGQHQSEIR